jgi:hypothetical protein
MLYCIVPDPSRFGTDPGLVVPHRRITVPDPDLDPPSFSSFNYFLFCIKNTI